MRLLFVYEKMKKQLILLLLLPMVGWTQKETKVNASIDKVTVFKAGAQVHHTKSIQLSAGKQVVIFEKLTDFIDPNSVQLKSSPNAVILSVRTRKNFDESALAKQDINGMNEKKSSLERKEEQLRDEYRVLLFDEQLLLKNNYFGSQTQPIKTAELKEATIFYHVKMGEIQTRKTQLNIEIETTVRKINEIEQEIVTKRSLPVVNYTELEVELDVEKAGETDFQFSYISPNASWKPYYDMRSNGIGAPIQLEAKGLVSQNTGIEWKNVELVLSTNDPYDNTEEPILSQWNLNYYSALPQRQSVQRTAPTYNYSGEVLHGEVIDASSGQPLSFAKIAMSRNPQEIYMTDATGKFSFTVPRYETAFNVSYLGYDTKYIAINSPYVKIALVPQEIAMEELDLKANEYYATPEPLMTANSAAMYADVNALESVTISSRKTRKKNNSRNYAYDNAPPAPPAGNSFYSTPVAQQTVKDLRMEFAVNTPFTIPSDNADHRVSIAVYQLNANYEYHSVPKFDPSVYLVAQVSGWEKLNLLSGESNIYFDGTFIGKSFVDVNSSKDTIGFSFGKDKKVIIERTRSTEMSKTRLIGSRYKYEVMWDFTVRNNGGATIPIVIKDQFPNSINEDIKVKMGSYDGAVLDENTKILTWKFGLNKGETKKFKFDYSVDYGKGQPVYLE